MTHYVPLYAPMRGLLTSQALCGQFVLPCEEEILRPTCPDCARLLDARRNDRAKEPEHVAQ